MIDSRGLGLFTHDRGYLSIGDILHLGRMVRYRFRVSLLFRRIPALDAVDLLPEAHRQKTSAKLVLATILDIAILHATRRLLRI